VFKLINDKRRSIALAVVAVLALTGGAVAYWTATGAGAGAAQTASSQQALVVKQTSTLTSMYPGDSAQTLSGTFDNPNAGSIYVGTVTASISSVTKAADAPAGTCDATDFTLANTTMTVAQQVPAGNDKGTWSGATIKFNSKADVNQDACKGATVNLRYATA